MNLFYKISVFAFLTLFAFGGCAEFADVLGGETQTSQGITSGKKKRIHIVKEGETLEQIAGIYELTVPALVTANDLSDSENLQAGQKLTIPPKPKEIREKKEKKIPVAQREKKKTRGSKPEKTQVEEEAQEEVSRFVWPVDGRMTSGFGPRRKRDHDGIDIVAPKGTPVFASRDGSVLYSGKMSGYGNLIILKHRGNFFTAYAHLSEMGVAKGKRVKQGEQIGKVGRTGRASTTHLHFEIRHKTKAVDPMEYLPAFDAGKKSAN